MNDFIANLFRPSSLKRFIFFFVSDILIIIVSLYLAFLVRFEFALSHEYKTVISHALPFFVAVKLISFAICRTYKITWRYVGLSDLWNIACALILAESILMLVILSPVFSFLDILSPIYFKGFPRSIFLLDAGISFILLSGVRISKRVYLEVICKRGAKKQGKRTVIVGAGNTGEMIIRDMARNGFADFYPVGMLDDDKIKIGTYIHGVKVLGEINKLSAKIKKYAVEAVIIAIPSLNHKSLREMYNTAKEAKINTIKIVPRIYDFHRPEINLKALEEISIEDLIGRQVVDINYDEVRSFLEGKTVLVTGAGGSIGSEIVIQICAFNPEKVVVFDVDETDLHNMEMRLKNHYPVLFDRFAFITGDIRDNGRVNEVFDAYRPDIVFHAAAYKHVPMMEHNPKEAVKVNMLGTHVVAKAAKRFEVEKFIMISTDKAVRPTSVMGATKRMAEYICKALNNCAGKTEYISVRFGNVLGSRGSVLPLFMEQLKHGGPLTVTDKEMERYFMTIPEAVSLVLQASVTGKGGEVLVLDMGEPIKIVELAEELIKLHGLEPYEDIEIKFIGLRPGEKLFEETLTAEEGTFAGRHEKVFIANNSQKYGMEEIEGILKEFESEIENPSRENPKNIKVLLKKYVRHYEIKQ